jgi:hypothetical protein
MSIRFDEKGKFFTEIVSKEAVPVIIQTPTHQIHGNIHVRPGQRLKDEINQSETFFAVTEAIIYNAANEEIYRCDFMAVHREYIVWLLPQDQIMQPGMKKKSRGGDA